MDYDRCRLLVDIWNVSNRVARLSANLEPILEFGVMPIVDVQIDFEDFRRAAIPASQDARCCGKSGPVAGICERQLCGITKDRPDCRANVPLDSKPKYY